MPRRGRPGAFAENRFLQHSASLTGGTSGSPMFTTDGTVVAISNGGLATQLALPDAAGAVQAQTIASAAQIAFAIRADVIREFWTSTGW